MANPCFAKDVRGNLRREVQVGREVDVLPKKDVDFTQYYRNVVKNTPTLCYHILCYLLLSFNVDIFEVLFFIFIIFKP